MTNIRFSLQDVLLTGLIGSSFYAYFACYFLFILSLIMGDAKLFSLLKTKVVPRSVFNSQVTFSEYNPEEVETLRHSL